LTGARQALGTPVEQPETDEQRADRLETERDHAAGDHQHCGVTCEAEFPSDMLRNGILARAVPGSASMLNELLRRATRTFPAATMPDHRTLLGPADGQQKMRLLDELHAGLTSIPEDPARTVADTQPAAETAALAALRRIHAGMVTCRSGGDEWASEWLSEHWSTLPLDLRAAAGDTDAAGELAAVTEEPGR
ncbi:hypothetical protein, partial [Streptomyces sp. NPDC001948]